MKNKHDTQKNIIEGIHSVQEALYSKTPIKKIFISKQINLSKNNRVASINSYAKSNNINVEFVDQEKLNDISQTHSHQGIMAEVEAYNYSSIKDILQTIKKDSSLIIILDHIKDAGNLGAILRSAEAVGADGVIIPNKRSADITATTYKTSAGAVMHVPVAKVSNISNAISTLKDSGYWVCSASEHAPKNVWDENLNGKICLIMGSEQDGVSNLVLKNSDFYVKLPMKGNIESLNVAQACSVLAYEWLRQNS